MLSAAISYLPTDWYGFMKTKKKNGEGVYFTYEDIHGSRCRPCLRELVAQHSEWEVIAYPQNNKANPWRALALLPLGSLSDSQTTKEASMFEGGRVDDSGISDGITRSVTGVVWTTKTESTQPKEEKKMRKDAECQTTMDTVETRLMKVVLEDSQILQRVFQMHPDMIQEMLSMKFAK